jgi:hypothetical protein
MRNKRPICPPPWLSKKKRTNLRDGSEEGSVNTGMKAKWSHMSEVRIPGVQATQSFTQSSLSADNSTVGSSYPRFHTCTPAHSKPGVKNIHKKLCLN